MAVQTCGWVLGSYSFSGYSVRQFIAMNTFHHLAFFATWRTASRGKQYPGSPNNQRDGFVQLSPKTQVRASSSRHRVECDNILSAFIDAKRLGPNLRLEISSSGKLFSHFYGKLPLDNALTVIPLLLDKEGQHEFPPDIPAPNNS